MKSPEFLYTFILDYLGGTYISQVKAENNRQAIKSWIATLEIEKIYGFTNVDKKKLINDDFVDEIPVHVDGTTNVWCITVRTMKGFGIVNLIKTAID